MGGGSEGTAIGRSLGLGNGEGAAIGMSLSFGAGIGAGEGAAIGMSLGLGAGIGADGGISVPRGSVRGGVNGFDGLGGTPCGFGNPGFVSRDGRVGALVAGLGAVCVGRDVGGLGGVDPRLNRTITKHDAETIFATLIKIGWTNRSSASACFNLANAALADAIRLLRWSPAKFEAC